MMMSLGPERKFKGNFFVFSLKKLVKTCIFRASDRPSNVSGWQVMGKKQISKLPFILAYKPTLKLKKKFIKLGIGLYEHKSDLTQTN